MGEVTFVKEEEAAGTGTEVTMGGRGWLSLPLRNLSSTLGGNEEKEGSLIQRFSLQQGQVPQEEEAGASNLSRAEKQKG